MITQINVDMKLEGTDSILGDSMIIFKKMLSARLKKILNQKNHFFSIDVHKAQG